MLWIKRLIYIVIGLLALLMLVQTVASESGEVVTVTRTDAAGEEVSTRLWVIDHEGSQWLRSADPAAGWSSALSGEGVDGQAPVVIVMERDGAVGSYAVHPVLGMGAEINQFMREKYAWRDQVIRTIFGGDDATTVAFRLEPQ